jgi:hypothetical protein
MNGSNQVNKTMWPWDGYDWMTFENMAQGFIEQHRVWICAMI